MTRITMRVVLVLLVASCVGMAFADGDQTLTGSFAWEMDDGEKTGDLEAVFTKDGNDTWKVAFHFVWEGKDHTWKGTAKGSLTEGELTGEVLTDRSDSPTTFKFKGTFADGAFSGTHGQVGKDGELRETGTLKLAG